MHILRIKKLTFEAAHYLPTSKRERKLHGHSFTLENITVCCSKHVDPRKIKSVVKSLDHKILIPREDEDYWKKFWHPHFEADYIVIDNVPTVENIAEYLEEQLRSIDGVEYVTFVLYECPNQGVAQC